jgi:hypothetical protein
MVWELVMMGILTFMAPMAIQADSLLNGDVELGIMFWSGAVPVNYDAFSGRLCLEASSTEKVAIVEPWHPFGVVAGQTYVFSAWVRAPQEPCLTGISLRPSRGDGQEIILQPLTEIGATWTRISGSYTAAEGETAVRICFTHKCESGKGTLLLDDLHVNAPITELRQPDIDHHALMEEDSRQGHDLDRAYQVNGQKIDVVLFDLDELRRQGKTIPNELYADVENTGKELRRQWWELCSKREEFMMHHSRANADNGAIESFREQISAFEKYAAAEAQRIEGLSSELRKWLVYSRKPVQKDMRENRFMLVADYEWSHWGEDRLAYPGRCMNAEYEAKSANDLGLDLVTLLIHPIKPEQRKIFAEAFSRYCQAPFLVWSTDAVFHKRDMVSEFYFHNLEQLNEDTERFLDQYRKYPGFAGIQVDEPWVIDGRIDDILKNDWADYLARRSDYLQENRVENPRETPEWKIFKSQFLGQHLKRVLDMLDNKQIMTSICIMPTYEHGDPGRSPYVNSCRHLPIAGTDLYRNGSTIEGFHLQLFRSAMRDGRIWLLPGGTFSCKTPDNYKRSISNGIVHADGIHMWTNTYFSKYRDANQFWRYGAGRATLDDRKRSELFNWYPWGWEVMRERYHYAKQHADTLARRKSLADVALLVSERTRFLCPSQRYWNSCLATYNELVGMNQPFNAVFLEVMTEEKLKQYRVLVAPNLTAMTPVEIALLEKYTEGGGILLATPDFGTLDEWGRPAAAIPSFGMRFDSSEINTGLQEYNVSFSRRLIPSALQQLTSVVKANSRMPYQVVGLPFGVEVQIQKNSQGKILIQLLDYVGQPEITGHRLLNTATGEEVPLPPFHIHDMIIL